MSDTDSEKTARGGDRTPMSLRTPDFEGDVADNPLTRACRHALDAVDRAFRDGELERETRRLYRDKTRREGSPCDGCERWAPHELMGEDFDLCPRCQGHMPNDDRPEEADWWAAWGRLSDLEISDHERAEFWSEDEWERDQEALEEWRREEERGDDPESGEGVGA